MNKPQNSATSKLTRRVVNLPPKSSPSRNSQPLRERSHHERFFCGAKGDYVLSCANQFIATFQLWNVVGNIATPQIPAQ